MEIYESLYKIYYKDNEHYEEIARSRFSSEFAVHIDFEINGNPAFFIQIPELYKCLLIIEKIDKDIQAILFKLPPLSLHQFTRKCLIDEIVITNGIEGVHSTRREIGELLNRTISKKRIRWEGLVNKYSMLSSDHDIKLNTAEDVRNIYNDIVLHEVAEDDPDNVPDGVLFRKGSVSVTTPSGKEIHQGVYPEEKIIKLMNKALQILHDESINDIFRVAVFHYLFGYIHPFYDGNGRTSRFISSYLLSKSLNSFIPFRLSYTIQQQLKQYYDAFKICGDHKNKGDLTPFIQMFIDCIGLSMDKLKSDLTERLNLLRQYKEAILFLPNGAEGTTGEIYFLLIQAALFSEDGISMRELEMNTRKGKNAILKRLQIINSNSLLLVQKEKNKKLYKLNLEEVNRIKSPGR